MDYAIYRKYRHLAVESAERLAGMKNAAAGRDVYIIGSGASIRETDLSRLSGEIVILLNNAVDLLGAFSPSTALVVISDHLRALELRGRCRAGSVPFIVTTDKVLNPAVNPLIFAPPYTFVMPKFTVKPDGDLQISGAFGFSDDLRRGIYLGKSVVFPAIQIAYHLGARTISLVGIDMTLGANVSYFNPVIKSNWSAFDYARDGRPHFAVMRDCLRERGCILENLTVGGLLDVLPHDPQRLAIIEPMAESENA